MTGNIISIFISSSMSILASLVLFTQRLKERGTLIIMMVMIC